MGIRGGMVPLRKHCNELKIKNSNADEGLGIGQTITLIRNAKETS